jgi:hypothetical protein
MAEYYAQPVEYPNPPLQPDGRAEPRPEGVPAHAHEGTDVNIRPLVYTGVGLVIFLVATCIFLVFLFDLFSFVERKNAEVKTGLEGVSLQPMPADRPRVQSIPGYHDNTPAEDMRALRERNRRLLSTASTAKDGVARIPVDGAIDLALQRKLFKTAAAPAGTAPAKAPAAAPSAESTGAGDVKKAND